MKRLIKKIGCGILYHTQLYRFKPKWPIILAYHTVNPGQFERQIKHLIKHYKVVPLKDILNSDEKKSVALTFDDGYLNNAEHAYPILKKYGIPATVFVTYDFIEKDIFTWWDRLEHAGKGHMAFRLKHLVPEEIEKKVKDETGLLANSPKPTKYSFMNWQQAKKIMDVFEIGSHTLTHPILTTISLKKAQHEILDSKRRIEKKIGKPVHLFAYPNGNYNDKLGGIVKKSGYKGAVIYQKGTNSRKTQYRLYRRGINVNDNLAVFAAKVAGVF